MNLELIQKNYPVLVQLLFLLFFSCNPSPTRDQATFDSIPVIGEELSNTGYFLVWSDEFNEGEAIDTTKWYHQTEYIIPGVGWANDELQHYTSRNDNSKIEDGVLHIIAKKETYTDSQGTREFTSARLNSKYSFTYGRVEVKAKMTNVSGAWPAIWMLGTNIGETGGYWNDNSGDEVAWPTCGEIDIMEYWPRTSVTEVRSSLHTLSSSGNTVNTNEEEVPTVASDFHIYGMEWTNNKIIFDIDGIVHYEYAPKQKNESTWPFTSNQYLLLNVAVEKSTPTNDPNWESVMAIDYVRVYQKK